MRSDAWAPCVHPAKEIELAAPTSKTGLNRAFSPGVGST